MAVEPFIFLACIICFFVPILLRRFMIPIQMIVGLILVYCIMVFHEDNQVKIIYLIAFIWVFGSISALSIKVKKPTV